MFCNLWSALDKDLFQTLIRNCSAFNYHPQQQLRKGNAFTSVCREFCSRGEYVPLGPGVSSSGLVGRGGSTSGSGRVGVNCPLLRQTPLGQTHSWADTPFRQTPHQADTPSPRTRPLQRTVRILAESVLLQQLILSWLHK